MNSSSNPGITGPCLPKNVNLNADFDEELDNDETIAPETTTDLTFLGAADGATPGNE